MTQSNQKYYRRIRMARIAVLLLICAAVLGAVGYAWLTHQRSVAAVAEIDAPRALWIRAGAEEDAKYLVMSDIDVEASDRNVYYVFAVAGEYINSFRLQLAYTTNNQFSYEIYEAEQTDEANKLVTYYPHKKASTDPEPAPVYYRVKQVSGQPVAAINLVPINPKSGSNDMLADKTQTQSTATYGNYANVHDNAWPLYWQTQTSIQASSIGSFCNYFILHVSWDPVRGFLGNNRETDMVYIAATAG